MTCRFDAERLSAYLDGELTGESRSEVERHLAACSSCAQLLKDMGTNDELARAAMTPSRPAASLDSMEARVLQRVTQKAGKTLVWRKSLSVAAAGILAAVFVYVFSQTSRPPRDDGSRVVRVPVVPALVEMQPGDIRSVAVESEKVFDRVMKAAQPQDLVAVQNDLIVSGLTARLNECRNREDVSEEVRRNLARLEAVLIGVKNMDTNDVPAQLGTFQTVIHENDVINSCRSVWKSTD